MNTIETYAKFSLHKGKLEEFRERVSAIVEAVRENDPGTLRYDWYINEERMEAVAMDAYLNEKAMFAHQLNCRELHRAVLACSSMDVAFLGMPSPRGLEAVSKFGPELFVFDGGLKQHSGVLDFSPYFNLPRSGMIEIVSRFSIQPGKTEAFKATAREVLGVVRENDPGTFRYDWFYDDANNQCIALDTYVDATGMFAHMKNAHDKHNELLNYATMATEFLGELPEQAMAVVGKYSPKIYKYLDGIGA